jgi:sterol desaturase/sphingolipid hydroxylase (fatty acid hydroxylase superfamily)
MDENQFQFLRGIGFLAAVGLAVGLQRLRPHTRLNGSWRTNGAFWAINVAVMGIVCGACACTVALWAKAAGVGLFNAVTVDPWSGVAVTIFALDLVSYAWHRANHQISFLWRFHQVHHSDPAFTTSTAVRFHPGELLLSLPLRLAAVVALGASPVGIVVFEILFAVANLFEHGNIDLPLRLERRLAYLWITPALHRRHHSTKLHELNRNFGTIFVFWDRALRTYLENSSAQKVTAGLPYSAEVSSLRQALVLPFRKPPRLRLS